MLKESDILDILGVIFDSKMTVEQHLRSVSTAASERHGIWGNQGEYLTLKYMFYIRVSVTCVDLK